jgi:hypothetical protein
MNERDETSQWTAIVDLGRKFRRTSIAIDEKVFFLAVSTSIEKS